MHRMIAICTGSTTAGNPAIPSLPCVKGALMMLKRFLSTTSGGGLFVLKLQKNSVMPLGITLFWFSG